MKKTDPNMDQTSYQNSKPWNVLVYLAADNNLKEEGVFVLTEIMKADTSGKVSGAVQYDSGLVINEYLLSNFEKTRSKGKGGIRAFEVIGPPQGDDSKKVSLKSAEEMLEDFLSIRLDANSTYNMVVLSGHGSGAVGSFLSSDRSPFSLTIPSLGNALKSVTERKSKRIDILGLDSCLMSMAEVCYEVKDSVDFLVGAEGFARNTGWPYHEIIEIIGNDPNISPGKLACSIVKEYIHYYAPYTISGVSVDQAACNLSQIQTLANKLGALSSILIDRLENRPEENQGLKYAIILAHWRAQSYKFEQYVDLWDFCEELQNFSADEYIVTACSEVQAVIKGYKDPKNPLVTVSCYSGAEFQHSHGISIYFPWASSDLRRDLPNYESLQFDKVTNWSKFLRIYGDITQREMREGDPNKGGPFDKQFMPIEHDLGVMGMLNVRLNLMEGTRLNLMEGTRLNLMEGTRLNLMEGTMGGQVILPKVKNPPDHFLKYQDDCIVDCAKQDEEQNSSQQL